MRYAALVVLFLFCGLSLAQHSKRESLATRRPAPALGSTATGIYDDRGKNELIRRSNAERQRQAIEDAATLARLSKELQDELNKANDAILPASSYKKADDIVKLAKKVKDKMRPLNSPIP